MGTRDPDEEFDILLVDDRPENLLALRAILDRPEYNLFAASDGSEALKLLLTRDFAVALLDVYMAGMDGFELATLIKSREKSRHMPIIFLTAMDADQKVIHRAYQVGAADYIHKPLDPEIVRAKVAVFVDLHRKEKEIARQAQLLRESELRERERAMEELRDSSDRRFHDLVEGISSGFVWSADPVDMRFSYVSPRAELILGYPLERWRDEPGYWFNHVHPEDREEVEKAFQAARTGKEVNVEHRFSTAEGSTVWLQTGVRLARKGAGRGVELRGLSVDISYMKRIESALKEAVQARDEFLSIASHELKTPLTPILLHLQMLERSLKNSDGVGIPRESLTRTLNTWRRQVDRLLKLIEELLDVSRITARKMELHPESMNLFEVVREVVDRHRAEAESSGTAVHVSGETQVTGTWDRSRIEQVLTNLLTNAMKYGRGKPVEIVVGVEGDRAHVSVQDHGIGISPENQKKIFERWERAVSSEQFTGLGLGLYIVRSIVEAHGGKIGVRSELGQGTTFVLELPLHRAGKRVA